MAIRMCDKQIPGGTLLRDLQNREGVESVLFLHPAVGLGMNAFQSAGDVCGFCRSEFEGVQKYLFAPDNDVQTEAINAVAATGKDHAKVVVSTQMQQ